MNIDGSLLIGGNAVRGGSGEFRATDAATGEALEPAFGGASAADLEQACALAEAAFDSYRETNLDRRAEFLGAIAQNILDIGEPLIVRTMAETGLPRRRVEGERGRTVGQLRFFADVVREGGFLDVRIDKSILDRAPAPRPDLRLRNIGVGPVAVFGASNFPLAFSVAGGDTASALAAGCPVIVKAHPAHPGVSALVGQAVQQAVRDCGLGEGVFSLLYDAGHEIGRQLVSDSRIRAVGFTGSRTGGSALMRIAAARPEPIPVYAEMSSINPVILFPAALAARGRTIGKAFAESLTLGAGQFCTNPGVVVAVEGPGLAEFISGAAEALSEAAAQTMLTPAIHTSYCAAVDALAAHPAVTCLGRGLPPEPRQGQAALFSTPAKQFLTHPELEQEIFGATSLLVLCEDQAEVRAVLSAVEGQLTLAMHVDPPDHKAARALLPLLERKAGRILVNGFGTGVEVAHAMVHGGPYPATADGRSTSVGSLAIARFLRPVCYQDVPADLLPPAIRDENPLGVWRRLDGQLGR